MNNDIRLRPRQGGRVAAIILSIAVVALAFSFALSFLPSSASAHTSTFDPNIVEEGGQVYVQIQANLAAGDHVNGVLAGWSEDSLQCYAISPAAVNDTDSNIVTDFGQIEFMMTAPAVIHEGGYTLFYQVTGSSDCQTLQGTLLTTDDVLDVILPEPITPAHTTVTQNFVVTAANMFGWFFSDDQNNDQGTGAFVFGPATPPVGQGSARLTATTSTESNALKIAAFDGFRLGQITGLSYSTYQDASNTSNTNAIALQLDVVRDITDASAGFEGRMVYEPYNNTANSTVTLGAWETHDTLAGGAGRWWLTYADAFFDGSCSQQSPCTISQLISQFPNIGTRTYDNQITLKAGNGWDSFGGAVDNVVITTDDSLNATTTTYDFEPTATTTGGSTGDTGSTGNGSTGDNGNGGSSSNNNGGGVVFGGPSGYGYVNTNPTSGQVLGTSTEEMPAGCDLYLTTYLKMGAKNDMSQVIKLQTFLNANLNAGLPVTGVFGAQTFAAVKKFQLMYWGTVLAPWVPFGLETDHTATGYVYKTTQRMINLVQCKNTITIPAPMLP